MGIPYRTFQDLENEKSPMRPVYMRATERAALAYTVEIGQPMLHPQANRQEALELSRIITG